MFINRRFKAAGLLSAFVVIFSMAAVDYAEARVRGGFGSRGARTFTPPAATQTVPGPATPINRTMTPAQPGTNARAPAGQAAQPRGGFFNGFGGMVFRGLLFGGLLGLLMGTGFGGMAGLLGLLFQVLLIGGAIYLVMRLMRGNRQPATAGGPAYNPRTDLGQGRPMPDFRNMGGGSPRTAARKSNPDELGVTNDDLDTFENLLMRVQTSYGKEDYAALRDFSTPEMMGYLAEQLGENASRGQRNHIADVKLLQGDVSESWREGNMEYATVAMRYELRDWTVERAGDRVIDGNPDAMDEAREIWTFVRQRGGQWKLSAIQEA